MIKTIIFDIYDTIIQVERHANAKIVMDHLRAAGIDPAPDEFVKLWGEYYRRAELSGEFLQRGRMPKRRQRPKRWQR